jgi:hypothetical protein
MEASSAVRTILAVSEFQGKPVPPGAPAASSSA